MPEPSPETVEAVFQEAADLDPSRRGAYLDQDGTMVTWRRT